MKRSDTHTHTDAAGRPLVPCAAEPAMTVTDPRWTLRRKPSCNRVRGHDGQHQELDQYTWAIRWQWAEGD